MKTIIIDGIEYNLTPKVHFKKGDFVVIQETTYLISKIEGLNVTLSCNGRDCLFDIDVLKNARLWDITKDAKAGDVLFMDNGLSNCIFIYKSSNNGIINKYASYNKFGFESEHYLVLNDGYVIPATKEQRDTLMKAMADAGYTFDFEKKELEKIVDKEQMKKLLQDNSFRRMFEQKPAWGEMDETYSDHVINAIKSCYTDYKGKENPFREPLLDWLNSLKDRYTWKPSDEQMDALHYVTNFDYGGHKATLVSLYNDLKRLLKI